MHNLIDQSKKYFLDRDYWVLCLIFLFPIGAYNIRHWASGIFVLLVFFSVSYLIKPKQKIRLDADEKAVVYFLFFYFCWFMITAFVNDWGAYQTRKLGVELRFLLGVPLFLMIRQINHSFIYLFHGVAVAILVTLCVVYQHEGFELEGVVTGPYSQLILGPVTAIFGFLTLLFWGQYRAPLARSVLLLLFVLAMLVTLYSGARGALLLIVAVLLVLSVRLVPGKKLFLAMGASTAFLFLLYSINGTMQERIDEAASEFYVYAAEGLSADEEAGSIATRFAMLELGYKVMQDYPLFGVGAGNYPLIAPEYVKCCEVHPAVAEHGHAHNIYTESLINKGLIGLLLAVLMMLFPFIYFYRLAGKGNRAALAGLISITSIAVFGLTEASPLIKGNWVAILVVLLCVFFVASKQERKVSTAA